MLYNELSDAQRFGFAENFIRGQTMQRSQLDVTRESIVLLGWANERLQSSLRDVFQAVDHEKLCAFVEKKEHWAQRPVETIDDVVSAVAIEMEIARSNESSQRF